LQPGISILNTGLSFEIPEGYVGLICDRGSTPIKHGLHVVAGVLDSDYRGELKIVVLNTGSGGGPWGRVRVEHKQCIAQMLVLPVEQVQFVQSENLEETKRGGNWNGSTGS
jgi:dUTP pyrophosphatase